MLFCSLRIKFFALCLCFFCFEAANFAAKTESDDLYVFNKSKIHIQGVLTPFEASVDIQETGMQKYVLSIYLHSAYAATPPDIVTGKQIGRAHV